MKITRRFRPFFALGIVVIALAGTADAAEGLEQRRVAQNAQCLAKMHGPIQPKIEAVIADLEGNGYKPIIDTGVWRSPAEQMKKYRSGVSKVTWSYHNASTPSGKPDSLAADIVDQRYGWTGKAPRAYWLKLANSARVHSLYSGAHFGLSTSNKQKLDQNLAQRNFAYSGPIGWDPAHVEVKGVSLGQARKGVRPKY